MHQPNGSALRAEINRSNAQYSTGPSSEEGKQRSSQNALQHGLTAKAAVIPGEDPAAYAQHLRCYIAEYEPKGPIEYELVEVLAKVSWRRKRLASIEADVLALENKTSEDLYRQTRSLANLSIYEHRLVREAEKARKELDDLQSERRRCESGRMYDAISLLQMHKDKGIYRRRWLRFFDRRNSTLPAAANASNKPKRPKNSV